MTEELTKRFSDAIRASFTPCPLIGPKWFRFIPAEGDGEEQDRAAKFEFTGTGKLAKALGAKPGSVGNRILMKLDLTGLGAEARVVPGYNIIVTLKGGK